MAYATQTRRAAEGASAWQWLGDLRGSLSERVAKYRLYRATLNELDSLSDRELADLGIHRADIGGIASEAAYSR